MFCLGKVVATAGVAREMEQNLAFKEAVQRCLERHSVGDWGDLDTEDKDANDRALLTGERLFSSYAIAPKIWIITEASREITTILFPNEY